MILKHLIKFVDIIQPENYMLWFYNVYTFTKTKKAFITSAYPQKLKCTAMHAPVASLKPPR